MIRFQRNCLAELADNNRRHTSYTYTTTMDTFRDICLFMLLYLPLCLSASGQLHCATSLSQAQWWLSQLIPVSLYCRDVGGVSSLVLHSKSYG